MCKIWSLRVSKSDKTVKNSRILSDVNTDMILNWCGCPPAAPYSKNAAMVTSLEHKHDKMPSRVDKTWSSVFSKL